MLTRALDYRDSGLGYFQLSLSFLMKGLEESMEVVKERVEFTFKETGVREEDKFEESKG